MLVKTWTARGRKQVISQAELLPVWLAKVMWRSVLQDRPLFTYVDNDAALHNLVGGYSRVDDSSLIVHASACMDAELGIHQWVSRVPSKSNLADLPSILDWSEVSALPNAQRTEIVEHGRADEFWAGVVGTLYKKWGGKSAPPRVGE